MHTKNAKAITAAEGRYLAAVKQLPCSVCDAPGPSDAHHIKQGDHWTVVALCYGCHRGPLLGWHGQKRAWAVRKLDELDALAITIRRVHESHGMDPPWLQPARFHQTRNPGGAIRPGQ